MKLTQKHIDSIKEAFLIMNEFAQDREGIKHKSPTEALSDVYLVLAQGFSETLREWKSVEQYAKGLAR